MPGKLIIRHIIYRKLFFAVAAVYADDLLRIIIIIKLCFQAKARFLKIDIKRIRSTEIAFCKAAVINGIQQVGFAHSV